VTGAELTVTCLWQELQRPLVRYLRAFDRSAAEALALAAPPARAEALFRTA
jgi:hypothetical protein